MVAESVSTLSFNLACYQDSKGPEFESRPMRLQLKNCFRLRMHIRQELAKCLSKVICLRMLSNLIFGAQLGLNLITCVSEMYVLEGTGQGLR